MIKKVFIVVIACILFIFMLEMAQGMLVEQYAVESAMEQMEVSGDSYAAMREYNMTMNFIVILETVIVSGGFLYLLYNLRKEIKKNENV